MYIFRRLTFLLIFSTCVFQLYAQPAAPVTKTDNNNPKREFRAAWVATVENIDWPSRPGLPVDQQKKELITLLDFLQDAGMNAVMFQIRPAADGADVTSAGEQPLSVSRSWVRAGDVAAVAVLSIAQYGSTRSINAGAAAAIAMHAWIRRHGFGQPAAGC